MISLGDYVVILDVNIIKDNNFGGKNGKNRF